MASKQDESYECQSDTQSIISSQFDQLNKARIQYSPITFLTPSVKNTMKKKKCPDNGSCSDSQDWESVMTRTIYNGSPKAQHRQKMQVLRKKYPRQVQNIKHGTVTVNVKNQTNTKYQNVCSICLDQYSNIRGLLSCGHKFCHDCITEWIKTSTNCPCCRAKFQNYVKITINEKKQQQKRELIKVQARIMEFNELDYFICLQCNRGDDQDVLLICDMCDFYCCHVYCDPSLRNVFPTGDWYCKHCRQTIQNSQREQLEQIRSQPNRTQTVINTQHLSTQMTRTLTLHQSQSRFQSDSDSQQTQQNLNNFISVRKTRAAHRAERTMNARSKIFSNISPKNPRDRLPNVINRIINNNNSTAINLRNLRRRVN